MIDASGAHELGKTPVYPQIDPLSKLLNGFSSMSN
jgi:hypothetical protein